MGQSKYKRSQESHPASQTSLVPPHELEHPVQRTPLGASLSQRARRDPRSLSHPEVQFLQRTIGNRAVAQLFQSAAQRSAAGTSPLAGMPPLTQADRPLASSPLPPLQPRASGLDTPGEVLSQKEVPLQRVAESAQPKENTTGLPDTLKAGVEQLSGMSLDDVQVHYNSAKPAQVQALAYTQGTEIHVGPSQELHLPHEAWHVVQQKRGRVQPARQEKVINANSDLEREADVMGEKVVQASSEKVNSQRGDLTKGAKIVSEAQPIQRVITQKIGRTSESIGRGKAMEILVKETGISLKKATEEVSPYLRSRDPQNISIEELIAKVKKEALQQTTTAPAQVQASSSAPAQVQPSPEVMSEVVPSTLSAAESTPPEDVMEQPVGSSSTLPLSQTTTDALKFRNFKRRPDLEITRTVFDANIRTIRNRRTDPQTSTNPNLTAVTDEQAVALRGYTTQDFELINPILRGANQVPPSSSVKNPALFLSKAELQPYINMAISGINQLPPFTTTEPIFRGTNLPQQELVSVLTQFNTTGSAEIRDSAFQSATLSTTVAKGVSGRSNKHLIRILEQKSAKDVAVFTSHPNEKEILFPPDTTWIVEKVTENNSGYEYVFDVKEK